MKKFSLILAFIIWTLGFSSFLISLLSISNFLFGINSVTFIPPAQIILTDLDETRRAKSCGISDFLIGLGFILN